MSPRTRSPFPGMDPWLEHPAWWPNVHQSLITYSRDALQRLVGDRYFVSIGERVYVETLGHSFYPDVAIVEQRPGRGGASTVEADAPVVVIVDPVEHREVFLEISAGVSGDRIVTVVEVLSPANKHFGAGRELYLRKQAEILTSTTSLVEIDLLRDGDPTVAIPGPTRLQTAYAVVVARAADRVRRHLYPVRLFDRLPRVAIPLEEGDPPAVLDLQVLLDETYDKGAFGRRIDYSRPPVPPLSPADEARAREIVATRI